MAPTPIGSPWLDSGSSVRPSSQEARPVLFESKIRVGPFNISMLLAAGNGLSLSGEEAAQERNCKQFFQEAIK